MLCAKLPNKDVQILLDNLHDASQFWDAISNDHEDEQYNDLVQSATHYYGGPESVLPFVDMKSLKKVLFGACKFLKRVLSEKRGLGKNKSYLYALFRDYRGFQHQYLFSDWISMYGINVVRMYHDQYDSGSTT